VGLRAVQCLGGPGDAAARSRAAHSTIQPKHRRGAHAEPVADRCDEHEGAIERDGGAASRGSDSRDATRAAVSCRTANLEHPARARDGEAGLDRDWLWPPNAPTLSFFFSFFADADLHDRPSGSRIGRTSERSASALPSGCDCRAHYWRRTLAYTARRNGTPAS
jgi:hypothetical protein